MLSLLETLITFIGVMLVLALAAQSVQELVKVMFTLKGQAALHGLKGLVNEAVRAEGLNQSGDDILKSVVRRLQGLGQNGVRRKALRLDTLTASQLHDLLLHVDPRDVSDLRTLHPDAGRATLALVAERASAWFPLAMDPVADRYRRRMRGVSLISAAAVVWAVNADALTIFRRARDDGQFRQRVGAATEELTGLHKTVRTLGESCVKASPARPGTRDTTAKATAADSACTALRPALHSLDQRALRAAADTAFLAGITGPRRPKDPAWWMGIVLSTLLVSLGAPFWHDALETMFGVKNRVRAEAKKLTAETLPRVERKVGPHAEAVVTGPADETLPD